MRYCSTLALSMLVLLSSSTLQATTDEPLSDFEKFRSYPLLDRAYRAQKQQNWKEVETLMRHLLSTVPNNTEAQHLLTESLVKQQRYADALNQAAQLADSVESHRTVFSIRLAWIAQELPDQPQMQAWLEQSQGSERVQLWQAYSFSLAKRYGAQRTLDWLVRVPVQGDERELRLARANWAEQASAWATVIEQLQPVTTTLPAEDWQRLANAYIQLLDEQGLQRLLQRPPALIEKQAVLQAMFQRAIAVGNLEMAKRWQPSPTAHSESVAQQQLWELARQSRDSQFFTELSKQLAKPCLETAEWLSANDTTLARAQLAQCEPLEDPKGWLVLAQRLQASDLLEQTQLAAPWDTARRELLLDIWLKQGRLIQAQAWLANQPQTSVVLRKRAELSQTRGQLAEAERLWESYYRNSGNLQGLNQASYLAIKLGRTDHARVLLERAYDKHDGHLPIVLLQRLSEIYGSTNQPVDTQRITALLPKVDAATRGQLLDRLAEAGQCDQVQRVVGDNPHSAGDLRALGRCAMQAQPGMAVVYYQAALAGGDQNSRQPLAYALEAAGDAPQAWQLWQELPITSLDNTARLTASRSALTAGDPTAAERYWQQAQWVKADDWALGATIAQARKRPEEALQRQQQALNKTPTAANYYAAAATAEYAGKPELRRQWLAEAVKLDPQNPRYQADYGMQLATLPTKVERNTAIPYLEKAARAFPENSSIADALAWRYAESGDSAAARLQLRKAIDLQQHSLTEDGLSASEAKGLYAERRAHETLSRRDSFTLASTWSPAGTTTNDTLFNTTQRSAQRQNVQLASWDHALGDEPSSDGSSLSIYGRALLGGEGQDSYGRSLGTGVGLRYRPFGDANLNLYSEVYSQSQLKNYNQDFTLAQWLNPPAVLDTLNDNAAHGTTTVDLLLRATLSTLDQGEYRNDWRVSEEAWNERSLYLDAAWWTRADDFSWLSRFQQGRTYKLPTDGAQTLMPYGFSEFSSQNPDHDWRQDLRSGVGMRWQLWYGDSKYDAYPSRVSVRTEYQWGLAGNLYQQTNGWLLGVEANF